MTNQTPTPPRNLVRGYGLITLIVLLAAIMTTGRPVEETVARVMSWGAPEALARAAMYIGPAIVLLAALSVCLVLARGRSMPIRWALYTLSGIVSGFTLGVCLDLFVGAPDVIALVSGPLSEASITEVYLSILAVAAGASSIMVALVALFGRQGALALQVDVVDPECVDVRRSERPLFAWSAVGMFSLAIACAALAVVRLAPETARVLPSIIGAVAALIHTWSSYALWRSFDELQRRHVIEGYAASAIVVTVGAFVWAFLEALSLAPTIDAAGTLLALISVQIVATSFVTTRMMGQSALVGKLA
jgi:hypothetical protein